MQTNTLVKINKPVQTDDSTSDWIYLALHPVLEENTRQEAGRCKPGETGMVVKARQMMDGKFWYLVLLNTGASGWLIENEISEI